MQHHHCYLYTITEEGIASVWLNMSLPLSFFMDLIALLKIFYVIIILPVSSLIYYLATYYTPSADRQPSNKPTHQSQSNRPFRRIELSHFFGFIHSFTSLYMYAWIFEYPACPSNYWHPMDVASCTFWFFLSTRPTQWRPMQSRTQKHNHHIYNPSTQSRSSNACLFFIQSITWHNGWFSHPMASRGHISGMMTPKYSRTPESWTLLIVTHPKDSLHCSCPHTDNICRTRRRRHYFLVRLVNIQ